MSSNNGYLLIVDDMRFICQLLSDALSTEGFAVKTALSGKQAIETIHTQIPSLIIIDQLMPGKNGLQTLKEVQDLISGVPVIMMSGDSRPERDITEAMNQGLFQDFITKPFDIPQLIKLVKEKTASIEG